MSPPSTPAKNPVSAGAGVPRNPPTQKPKPIVAAAKVRIVNSVCNESGFIRRRDAVFFVREGRAVELDVNHIRLIESHPKNIAAARVPCAFAASEERSPSGEKKFGPREDSTERHRVTPGKLADEDTGIAGYERTVSFRETGSPSIPGGPIRSHGVVAQRQLPAPRFYKAPLKSAADLA